MEFNNLLDNFKQEIYTIPFTVNITYYNYQMESYLVFHIKYIYIPQWNISLSLANENGVGSCLYFGKSALDNQKIFNVIESHKILSENDIIYLCKYFYCFFQKNKIKYNYNYTIDKTDFHMF
jgi:hypothetical protein